MLGTPPAFILSQDQTLVKSVCLGQESLLAILSLFTVLVCFQTVLKNLLLKKFSRVVVVYCSVIKVLSLFCLKRQLLYFIKSFIVCQELF